MKRFQSLIKNSREISKLAPQHYMIYYLIDMIFSYLLFGLSLQEYAVLEVYKLSFKQRKRIITRKDRDKLIKKYNNIEKLDKIENKNKFMRNHHKFIGREYLLLADSTLKDFFVFISHHTKFIAKHADGSQGKGIQIYVTNKYTDLLELYEELLDLKYDIIEELLYPHEDFAEINKYGLPVVRVMTFCKSENNVEIIATSLTVSVYDPIVNNNRDGLKMIVNPLNGQVISQAANRKKCYREHPMTNQTFTKFTVPYWNDLLVLVKEIALENKEFRYVGWDMAVTAKGPVVIEANAKNPGVTSMQYPCYQGVTDFYNSHKELLLKTRKLKCLKEVF